MRVINGEVCGSAILEKNWIFGNSKLFWLNEEGRENRERKKERKLK